MNKYIILLIILLIAIIIYFDYKKSKIENLTRINNSVINFLSSNYLNINRDGAIELQTRNGKKVGLNINRGVVNMGPNFSFDPSNNNLQCGNFNIDKQGKIKKGDTILVDPSGNINIGDFVYDKRGRLNKKDNSLNIDPSGNINIAKFMYNANGKLTTKDNSLEVDPSNNIVTPDYEFNPLLKSFKKRDGSYEEIQDSNKIKCGNNDIFYISKIILETPASQTLANPLHIASIRFFDIGNNVIQPNNYTTTMTNGTSQYSSTIVNSYNLFYNKTINFTNTTPRTPIIQPRTNLTPTDIIVSERFIGHGNIYLSPHQYVFEFTPPVLIKYVEIENRKDCCWDRIQKASLQIFTKNERNQFEEKYRRSLVQVASPTVIQNNISPPTQTSIKTKGTVEKYSISNYNNATGSFPVDYEPILRYYVQ